MCVHEWFETMCDADMGDVMVGGKRRQRNDTVYYWDKAEGRSFR